MIGPKGKVINTIQQETGADIGVDDDGARGIVTIGAVEAWRMEEAKAAILAIVDPPKAELGKIYNGRVVNITKFGAFVNILPGRDGLVHISKLGRGKRINAVEDVLSLGQEIEVRVDEIDDKGKVSLVPVGDAPEGDSNDAPTRAAATPSARRPPPEPSVRAAARASRTVRPANRTVDRARAARHGDVVEVSFEDSFDAELAGELGDLGPASERPVENTGGGRRNDGGRRRHR